MGYLNSKLDLLVAEAPLSNSPFKTGQVRLAAYLHNYVVYSHRKLLSI